MTISIFGSTVRGDALRLVLLFLLTGIAGWECLAPSHKKIDFQFQLPCPGS